MLTALITGANRGLGLALAAASLRRGYRVYAAARAPGAPLAALGQECPDSLTILQLDVCDPASIAAAAAAVDRPIDLLLNNAAIHSRSSDIAPGERNLAFGDLEPAGMLKMLRTNAIGPLLVTQALAPRLRPGSKVINLSSRRGSIAGKAEGGNYGYCASKAALNMITRGLAADLLPAGVIVAAVHPGLVRTAMASPGADLSPEDAAENLLSLAESLTPDRAGAFLGPDGRPLPW